MPPGLGSYPSLQGKLRYAQAVHNRMYLSCLGPEQRTGSCTENLLMDVNLKPVSLPFQIIKRDQFWKEHRSSKGAIIREGMQGNGM